MYEKRSETMFGRRLFGKALAHKHLIVGVHDMQGGMQWLIRCQFTACKNNYPLNYLLRDGRKYCIPCISGIKFLQHKDTLPSIRFAERPWTIVHSSSRDGCTRNFRICAHESCEKTITLNHYLRSGENMCTLHRFADHDGRVIKAKLLKDNKHLIAKVTEKRLGAHLYHMYCATPDCLGTVTYPRFAKGARLCAACLRASKMVLGLTVRNKIYFENKDKIVRIGGTTSANRKFYVRCATPDCCGEVEFKAFMSGTRTTCRRCTKTLRGLPVGMSQFKALQVSAASRGIACDLTYQEFKSLFDVLDCHYCRQPLNRALRRHRSGTSGSCLDRVRNEVGYTYLNLVPCCGRCNAMKHLHMSYLEARFLGALRARLPHEARQAAEVLLASCES